MNPFDAGSEPDRYQIWQRLVAADCEAFANGNWSMIAGDFDAESFEGVRCFHSPNPDVWKITFPDLASYRDSWLTAAKEFGARKFAPFHILKRCWSVRIWTKSTSAVIEH